MALCSQSFTNTKRNFEYPLLAQVPNKRPCLLKMDLGASIASTKFTGCFNLPSSSESDVDSDDQQLCYLADQVRAKRRASSRVSFCVNDQMSKALSQYSDDEDVSRSTRPSHLRSSSTFRPEDEDLDCNFLGSPSSSSNLRGLETRSSNSGSFLHISDSCSLVASVNRVMPACDKHARLRCFDYLIGAIDEAWASYCNAASYVEDETYGYNSPASVATDDEDYCGNTTDLTDYESDHEHEKSDKTKQQRGIFSQQPQQMYPAYRKPSIMGLGSNVDMSRTGQDPSSCRLQALKERLIKAKYFLQDLVDSDDYNEAFDFWKRWDMIKYATIELVEDDDDDTVMESTIDELEHGRQFSN